jgi:hypothetical protein
VSTGVFCHRDLYESPLIDQTAFLTCLGTMSSVSYELLMSSVSPLASPLSSRLVSLSSLSMIPRLASLSSLPKISLALRVLETEFSLMSLEENLWKMKSVASRSFSRI